MCQVSEMLLFLWEVVMLKSIVFVQLLGFFPSLYKEKYI